MNITEESPFIQSSSLPNLEQRIKENKYLSSVMSEFDEVNSIEKVYHATDAVNKCLKFDKKQKWNINIAIKNNKNAMEDLKHTITVCTDMLNQDNSQELQQEVLLKLLADMPVLVETIIGKKNLEPNKDNLLRQAVVKPWVEIAELLGRNCEKAKVADAEKHILKLVSAKKIPDLNCDVGLKNVENTFQTIEKNLDSDLSKVIFDIRTYKDHFYSFYRKIAMWRSRDVSFSSQFYNN